jgi:hypothetical protein
MTPIEAGARALHKRDMEVHSEGTPWDELSVITKQAYVYDARAAVIATVGALQEPEFDVWDLAGDVRTPEEFREFLSDLLTVDDYP